MNQAERERRALTVLMQLLWQHFSGKELEWSYREGVSLLSKDRELYIQIAEILPEVLAAK